MEVMKNHPQQVASSEVCWRLEVEPSRREEVFGRKQSELTGTGRTKIKRGEGCSKATKGPSVKARSDHDIKGAEKPNFAGFMRSKPRKPYPSTSPRRNNALKKDKGEE